MTFAPIEPDLYRLSEWAEVNFVDETGKWVIDHVDHEGNRCLVEISPEAASAIVNIIDDLRAGRRH